MGLAYAIGGWAVKEFGWRAAFLIAGVPGLIVAPLFYATVRNFPKGLADGLSEPRIEPVALGEPLKWKYRGQVLPSNRLVQLEVDTPPLSRELGYVTHRHHQLSPAAEAFVGLLRQSADATQG